jgi:hypothetical protein
MWWLAVAGDLRSGRCQLCLPPITNRPDYPSWRRPHYNLASLAQGQVVFLRRLVPAADRSYGLR